MIKPIQLCTANLVTLIMVFATAGCEKVIDVELNTADPQLVIEANMLQGDHLLDVRISQTTSYFTPEPAVAIDDATVTLNYAENHSRDVLYLIDGQYQVVLDAPSNTEYTLTVNWNGKQYTATSYLPKVVPIDSLTSEEWEGGFGGFGSSSQDEYVVYCQFQDPAESRNYYRLTYEVNGRPADPTDIQIFNDENSNGEEISIPIGFGRLRFLVGDQVEVHLISFDEAAYDYFLTLSDIVSGGGNPTGGSAAPGNPVNNWSDTILGHFTAYSADTMNITVR